MINADRDAEFEMYLNAGRTLSARGDIPQAEKVLRSGLKRVEEHLARASQLRLEILASLAELNTGKNMPDKAKQEDDGNNRKPKNGLDESELTGGS
jgi:hypothetical protein